MFKEFNSILELLQTFSTEQECIDYLEYVRWNGNVISPYDKSSKVYKCKNNRYKCKNTRKLFNVRTGTMFDNTKIPLQKWFLAIWLVTSHKKGISSVQLSKDIGVTQKTAWFMLQRIRNCFHAENDNDLDGDVEADETYIGGKGKKNSQGRSLKHKSIVFGSLERGGKVNAKRVDNAGSFILTNEIIRNVKETATLYTDEWLGYKGVAKIYDHLTIKHNQGEYVNGCIHTNTIEGFWSLLKRGLVGIYHSTSKKHLQKYVDEFVFRYNTKDYNECDRFSLLLKNMTVRTRYEDLIFE